MLLIRSVDVLMMLQAIDNAVEELQQYANVRRLEGRSVISLTGNTEMSSFILEKVTSRDTLST